MRLYLIVSLLIQAALCSGQVQQTDSTKLIGRVLDWFTHDNKPPEKPRFIWYPTLAYSPETSLELGLAGSVLFHMKNDHINNRLSEITTFGFLTLNKQYGFWFDNAVYGDRNRWILLGRTRFQYFPLLYYGIGKGTPDTDPTVVEGVYALIRQHHYRQIHGNWFAGIQADYQQLTRVHLENNNPVDRPIPFGASGTRSVALGTGIIYDSRPNYLNTRQGAFAELSWLRYANWLGSDYAFHVLSTEVRHYQKVRKNEVLALQAYANRVIGTEVPFNMLSLMGNESLMRGYYTGRYRDKQYCAAQAEYRWLPFAFSKRLGGAAFAGVGAIGKDLRTLGPARWAAGAGMRYLLFPKKDIFLRIDCGMTNEGPGFYIFTGEAF
jgi:Omp85 superfamily domain